MTVGQPDSDQFTEVVVDEFRVYLYKDARLAPQVVIDAPGLGFFRKLRVAGLIL